MTHNYSASAPAVSRREFLGAAAVTPLAAAGAGAQAGGGSTSVRIPKPIGSPVLESGLQFLLDSKRDDGSWPIDTNLATWVTTLSIGALAGAVAWLDRRDVAQVLGQRQAERLEHAPEGQHADGVLVGARPRRATQRAFHQLRREGDQLAFDLAAPGPTIRSLPEYTDAERVRAELEVLGLDASRHLVTFFEPLLVDLDVTRSIELRRRRADARSEEIWNVEHHEGEDDERKAPFQPALMAPHPVEHRHWIKSSGNDNRNVPNGSGGSGVPRVPKGSGSGSWVPGSGSWVPGSGLTFVTFEPRTRTFEPFEPFGTLRTLRSPSNPSEPFEPFEPFGTLRNLRNPRNLGFP